MNLIQRIVRQSQKEYSASARLLIMACGSTIFVFGIPAFLFWLSKAGGDRWRFSAPAWASSIGLVVTAAGLFLALWTAWKQFRFARGTPIPIMATKLLLMEKPYSFCRNPMALGTILAYFGVSFLAASYASMLCVSLFTIFLAAYIKLVEEKEMALRFGDEYLQYKRNTPFLVPRFLIFWKKYGVS
ncbi:MAG: isoprenylcysteine carboxylmethyltransferase family protein [Candidatus Omnitrophota bacterium]